MADFDSRYKIFHDNLMKRENFTEETRIFREEKDIRTMLRYVWSLNEFHGAFQMLHFNTSKDNLRSIALHADGINFVINGQLDNALRCFNESIFFACYPHPSNSLAVGHVRRVGVYFTMERDRLCILEVRRALASGCPSHLHCILIRMELACWFARFGFNCATNVYNRYVTDEKYKNNEMLQQSLKEFMSEYPRTGVIEPEKEGRSQEFSTASDVDDVLSTLENTFSRCKMYNIRNRNKIFVSASEALEMVFYSNTGRGFRAARDILPGEIIIQEKPVCASLFASSQLTHCTNCLRRLERWAPIPCKDCSNVIFCDNYCRSEATESFHSIECSMLPSMMTLKMEEDCRLTLRIICQSGAKELLNKFQEYEAQCLAMMKGDFIQKADYIYRSDDILNIFHLSDDIDDLGEDDMLFKCAVTLFILKLFVTHGYCKSIPAIHNLYNTRLSDEQMNLATSIFMILGKLSCNTMEIIDSEANKAIGSCLLLTTSLLNHSCDPNMMTHFTARGMTSRASQFIKTGNEVQMNYVDDFYTSSRATRRQMLNDIYHFDCSCIACDEHWPTYDLLPQQVFLRCPNCSSKFTGLVCDGCKIWAKDLFVSENAERINFRRIIRRKTLLVAKFLSTDSNSPGELSKRDIDAASTMITFINKYCIMPTQQLRNAQNVLGRGMTICGSGDSDS